MADQRRGVRARQLSGRNFKIDGPDSSYVLKVANNATGLATLAAQNAVLRHLAEEPPAFRAPIPLAGRDGLDLHVVDLHGDSTPVRLLTFLEGLPLGGRGYLAPIVVAELGRLSGLCSRALSSFDHPGVDRFGQWDLRVADEVVSFRYPPSWTATSARSFCGAPQLRQLVCAASPMCSGCR